MLSEIMKIKPQIDSAALANMVRTMNQRFADVAKKFSAGLVNATKKFGGGMKAALTGGGIVGLLGGLADRFLNPLQETTETLKRVLSEGDDLSTFAKQFETTSGRLLKLQALAGSSGLDPESLRMLLTKFQVALAEQRQLQADTTKTEAEKRGPLQEFTGIKDTAEAFFQFIQALQKVDKDTQVLLQSQIFGEKLIGRQSEFLQTDFGQRLQQLNLPGTDALSTSIENIAGIEEIDAIKRAQRQVNDILKKGTLVNAGMVNAVGRSEQQQLDQENIRLAGFESMRKAADATNEIKNKLESIYLEVLKGVPVVVTWMQKVGDGIDWIRNTVEGWNIGENLRKIADSPIIRGVKGFFK